MLAFPAVQHIDCVRNSVCWIAGEILARCVYLQIKQLHRLKKRFVGRRALSPRNFFFVEMDVPGLATVATIIF